MPLDEINWKLCGMMLIQRFQLPVVQWLQQRSRPFNYGVMAEEPTFKMVLTSYTAALSKWNAKPSKKDISIYTGGKSMALAAVDNPTGVILLKDYKFPSSEVMV